MASVAEVKAGLAEAVAKGQEAPVGHAREALGKLGTAGAVEKVNDVREALNTLLGSIVEVPWPDVAAQNQGAAERVRGVAQGVGSHSTLKTAAAQYADAAEKGTEVNTHLGLYKNTLEEVRELLDKITEKLTTNASDALGRAGEAVNQAEADNAAGQTSVESYVATL